MNSRSIAIALVFTSPTLLAYAENIRGARELAPERPAWGPTARGPLPTDPREDPEPQEVEPQNPQLSDQNTEQTSGERQPVPKSPQISSLSVPNDTRKKNPDHQYATAAVSSSSPEKNSPPSSPEKNSPPSSSKKSSSSSSSKKKSSSSSSKKNSSSSSSKKKSSSSSSKKNSSPSSSSSKKNSSPSSSKKSSKGSKSSKTSKSSSKSETSKSSSKSETSAPSTSPTSSDPEDENEKGGPSSPYPTNDCITYSILDPWESEWGNCASYEPGYMPWSNNDYCDVDVGLNDGVSAEDACPQCGKCLDPENMCVAFGKGRPFDAGFGGCDSYREGLENHDYCYYDVDNGITAFEACAECNKCVESSPRTVKVSVEWLRPFKNGDDFDNDVEIIGDLGSQLDSLSRTFWKSHKPFEQINAKQLYTLGKTHYYRDVGDWQYISVKGTLKEYDGDEEDYLGSQKKSLNVGKLYQQGTISLVLLEWKDRKDNDIKVLFTIEVN